MPRKQKRRSSYVATPTVELPNAPVYVWGYNTAGDFVCRMEINAAGVALYSGTKGKKKLCNVTWERLVAKLTADD